jgi:hypothetical protein
MTTNNMAIAYIEDDSETVQINYAAALTQEDVSNAVQLDETLEPLSDEMDGCFRGIWIELIGRHYPEEARPRRPPKSSGVRQLKILLTNLYVAYENNAEGCVSYPTSPAKYVDDYKVMMHKLVRYARTAQAEGYLKVKPGVKGLGYTCAFPTEKLIKIFKSLEVS